MRKLPRRLPSNSPSLAWVGFALLLLAVGGGMAGLYTHRQNQETAKKKQIETLRREVELLQREIDDARRQVAERLTSVPLKLKMKQYDLALRPIEPGEKVVVPAGPEERLGSGPSPAVAAPSPSPLASPSPSPSVMAVLGRP
jgi:cell division protein FtsB